MKEFSPLKMEKNPAISLNTRAPETQKLSKKEQMATKIFVHYLAWRKTMISRFSKDSLPFTKDDSNIKEVHFAINRQVALAVISDLEYNFRKTPRQIDELTGKSPVYWNFSLLGTTTEGSSGKMREEQKTSDYFIASLLNSLEDHAIELDWKRLAFYLEAARYRVIAIPADREKRAEWQDLCRKEGLDPGINYPAPWHVANWCGERITREEQQVYFNYPANADLTISPGRIKRVDVACFGPDGNRVNVIGEKEFLNRPTILKGLGARTEKRVDGDHRFFSPEFEEALKRTRRKLGALEQQERERRMAAEQKVEELEAAVLHLDYELAKANEKLKEMDELKKQNKKMDLWGKEMKKRLKQINTLSWEGDMKRNVGKD